MKPPSDRIVLASASPTRRALLAAAGVGFEAAPAAVDEADLRQRGREAGWTAVDCALALAEAKARAVAAVRPEALVIGADQILDCGGRWLEKPADTAAARAQLLALRGETHELATAVCVVRNGECLWRRTSRPRLTMRHFSDGFLDAYLAAEGAAVLGSVGAYRLEGLGAQLFSHVEGDHFAILGLPLIDLLGFLRDCGALCR